MVLVFEMVHVCAKALDVKSNYNNIMFCIICHASDMLQVLRCQVMLQQQEMQKQQQPSSTPTVAATRAAVIDGIDESNIVIADTKDGCSSEMNANIIYGDAHADIDDNIDGNDERADNSDPNGGAVRDTDGDDVDGSKGANNNTIKGLRGGSKENNTSDDINSGNCDENIVTRGVAPAELQRILVDDSAVDSAANFDGESSTIISTVSSTKARVMGPTQSIKSQHSSPLKSSAFVQKLLETEHVLLELQAHKDQQPEHQEQQLRQEPHHQDLEQEQSSPDPTEEEPSFRVHRGPNVKYHIMVHKEDSNSSSSDSFNRSSRRKLFSARRERMLESSIKNSEHSSSVPTCNAGSNGSLSKSVYSKSTAVPDMTSNLSSRVLLMRTREKLNHPLDMENNQSSPSIKDCSQSSASISSTSATVKDRSLTDLLSDVKNSSDKTIRSILSESAATSDLSYKSPRKLLPATPTFSTISSTTTSTCTSYTTSSGLVRGRSTSLYAGAKTPLSGQGSICPTSSSLVAKIINSRINSRSSVASPSNDTAALVADIIAEEQMLQQQQRPHLTNYRKMTAAVEKPPRKSRSSLSTSSSPSNLLGVSSSSPSASFSINKGNTLSSRFHASSASSTLNNSTSTNSGFSGEVEQSTVASEYSTTAAATSTTTGGTDRNKSNQDVSQLLTQTATMVDVSKLATNHKNSYPNISNSVNFTHTCHKINNSNNTTNNNNNNRAVIRLGCGATDCSDNCGGGDVSIASFRKAPPAITNNILASTVLLKREPSLNNMGSNSSNHNTIATIKQHNDVGNITSIVEGSSDSSLSSYRSFTNSNIGTQTAKLGGNNSNSNDSNIALCKHNNSTDSNNGKYNCNKSKLLQPAATNNSSFYSATNTGKSSSNNSKESSLSSNYGCKSVNSSSKASSSITKASGIGGKIVNTSKPGYTSSSSIHRSSSVISSKDGNSGSKTGKGDSSSLSNRYRWSARDTNSLTRSSKCTRSRSPIAPDTPRNGSPLNGRTASPLSGAVATNKARISSLFKWFN